MYAFGAKERQKISIAKKRHSNSVVTIEFLYICRIPNSYCSLDVYHLSVCVLQPPEDIRALILAWRMSAKDMGYFTRDEFIGGMRSLRCDSIEALRKTSQQLDKEVRFSKREKPQEKPV